MRPRSRPIAHQSKKFIERKQMRGILILILIVISVFSWIFTFSRISMLSIFSINSIKVSGISSDIALNMQAAAQNALEGNYLGIFSRSNTLLYPHDSVVVAVANLSPQIDTVNVDRDGINGLSITVKEKTPAAIVCTNLPEFSSNELTTNDVESCYLSDAKGYLYANAPAESGNLYHRYYIPALADSLSSTTGSALGGYATSTQVFDSLQRFYEGVLNTEIQVLAILVKDGGEYELYAVSSGDPVIVYFNDSRPLEEELANLIAFWERMITKTQKGGKAINFEYIDVRYGSNVFYR